MAAEILAESPGLLIEFAQPRPSVHERRRGERLEPCDPRAQVPVDGKREVLRLVIGFPFALAP